MKKYDVLIIGSGLAAGDCTNSAFKQIVIAQGSGATAALGSYQYLMRK